MAQTTTRTAQKVAPRRAPQTTKVQPRLRGDKKASKTISNDTDTRPLGTINYVLMGVGLVILALGYILLSGGGSDDPNTFNPAMFDNRRLVVAPILIVVGFVVEILAIMYKARKK